MSSALHHELLLPNPLGIPERPRDKRLGIAIPTLHTSWLELHRPTEGKVRFLLGAQTPWDLSVTFAHLQEAYPGLQLGPLTTCPIGAAIRYRPAFLRAIPNGRTHYWPIRLIGDTDPGGIMARLLATRELSGHDLVLQLLFRRIPFWESGLLSKSYRGILEGKERDLVRAVETRHGEPAYHVEIRVVIDSPDPELSADALLPWLRAWSSIRGTPWWSLEHVRERQRTRFFEALRDHEITQFASRKGRRDVSGTELTAVLPIPWKEHHPELSYAGAPTSRIPFELAAPVSTVDGLEVGRVGGRSVCLPVRWNHLAIFGRTRTGKSTLAENLVLQVLAKQPDARVVVLEPTGSLIQSIVDRLPGDIAEDAVEIDPSHPTFEQDGVEMASVPLNLLHLPDRSGLSLSEFEGRVERIAGDLFQSIRNAWGEESIGGRAEFVLRALLQGLLPVEGTNLVDTYSALSDKKVLQRLERLSSGTQLKSALKTHLPRLDYSLTISSLDKVGKVATNPLLRKALCQRYRPVGFDQLLEHRLLLLNLNKSTLGSEASAFLGAIFLTQLWSAIQERARPDPPVYLVVDEFPNFAIPAFADMLSEGARLGLHVVTVAQYLDRIPPKVKSALLGNVDSWVFFPLGTEDVREAWNIVQGSRFGWTPEHLQGGLSPHQAALATRDALLKVDTLPPTPATPGSERMADLVRKSTYRWAWPEDSDVSPLGVSPERMDIFRREFRGLAPRTMLDLKISLKWRSEEVYAAIELGRAMGDIVENNLGDVGLTFRGHYHRLAREAARNEGEEHSSLLADAAAFLAGRGVQLRIVPQGGGYLRPDAEFEWHGQTYSLEVECSTLEKHPPQVLRNVHKAIAERRRCLVVVADRETADRFLVEMQRSSEGFGLWKDVGLTWRERIEELVPYEGGSGRPWGFLPGGSDAEEPEPAHRETGHDEPSPSHSSDLARVREIVQQLLAAGKSHATAADFEMLFVPNDRGLFERNRLGMALATLGLQSRRVRNNGHQERLYDLSPFAGGQPPNTSVGADLSTSLRYDPDRPAN